MSIKYYSLCIAAFFARIVPMRLGYFLAGCGGGIIYLVSGDRRRKVGSNIQRAMGVGANRSEIKRKTRQVFKNAAKNYFDLFKLSRTNLGKMNGKVTIEGMQNLTQAFNEGKGVIIATAHLGNFEFGAHVVASHGFEMMVLVEDFNNTPFLEKVSRMRQGKGVRIFPVGIGSMKEGIRTLRRGGIMTIVCDRDLDGTGIKIPFLGQETSFPVGVVDMALRTGAAIVPIFSLRGPGNTTSIYIEPPLKQSGGSNRDQAERENLESLVAIIEKYIKKYPEQWVVLEG